MDPTATIAQYLTTPKRHTSIRMELLANLRRWYYIKGFHPMVEDVRLELIKTGKPTPNGWSDDARTLGAR